MQRKCSCCIMGKKKEKRFAVSFSSLVLSTCYCFVPPSFIKCILMPGLSTSLQQERLVTQTQLGFLGSISTVSNPKTQELEKNMIK